MQKLKATSIMIVAELLVSGVAISYKFAVADGMHLSVLIAYRYLFASIFILPLALVIERNIRPKLTWMIIFQAFLCATFGGPMAQNLYAESLVLTSATFVAAFTNLILPFTFIIAVLFGLEKVEIGKTKGKAKVIGTLVGVGGAMLLTFYKGQQLDIWSTHFNLLNARQCIIDENVSTTHNSSTHHIIGSILALAYSLSIALYFTLQSKMSANYPCHYSSTFLFGMIGFVQSFIYALYNERSWSRWKLGWNVRLFSVLFQGPLFVSNFNPLVLVNVAIAGFFLLDEKLHVGSVLGSIIIIVGLYLVLWGKSEEVKRRSMLTQLESSDDNDISNTITTKMTLEPVSMPPTLLSIVDNGNQELINCPREKHREQEIVEEA